MWHDDYFDDDGGHWDDDDDDDNIFFEWYDGYKKGKAQKTKIKKRVNAHCFGTHQDTGFGVFLKMKNKRQKTCGHKNGPFLCLVYRNIF